MRPAALLIAGLAGLGLWACAIAPAPEARSPSPAQPFDWQLPLGFPPPIVPADNPMSAAKVELGRHLFYDPRLSGTGKLSCASCHAQELAFTDGRPRALGATGELHPRSAMSLANVAYNASFAWADPSLLSLEAQVHVPMFNRDPVELGVEGEGAAMVARIAADSRYEAMFANTFPHASPRISLANIVKAIATFERTLISGRSAYDRHLFLDERTAMSAEARAGLRLFTSPRLGCAECHSSFNFSGTVRAAGLPSRPLEFHNTGLYNLRGKGLYPPDNPGLAEHSGKKRHIGRFRAPTLRNIALTAPYMHDGSIATLAEVIEHYAAGGRTLSTGPYAGVGHASPRKSSLVQGFQLSKQEKGELIAFLESLTDEEFVRNPRLSNPWLNGPSPGMNARAMKGAR
ncbi:MAG: MbnH family di-heme enzyme [Acidobacteriota bacterium]